MWNKFFVAVNKNKNTVDVNFIQAITLFIAKPNTAKALDAKLVAPLFSAGRIL